MYLLLGWEGIKEEYISIKFVIYNQITREEPEGASTRYSLYTVEAKDEKQNNKKNVSIAGNNIDRTVSNGTENI